MIPAWFQVASPFLLALVINKGPCQLEPNHSAVDSIKLWSTCMCDALDSNKRMEKSFHALYEEAESKHELVALVSGSKRKLEATKTAARYEDGDNETEAFLPGSLIYYFGAFGQPLAIHSGVYIGE
eukprot:gene20700-3648_t